MKFLIQTVRGKIVHDFAFTLLKSIEFRNWLKNVDKIGVKYLDTHIDDNGQLISPIEFKQYHKNYVPVGSVEFVTAYLQHFYNNTPKPQNVPKELCTEYYSRREIINGNHMDLEDLRGKWFVKSADKIKGFAELIDLNKGFPEIPAGNYQISDEIQIESEWRAFVYNGKLVGLQNYSGEVTCFPDGDRIESMISAYKSAPIAYTLDVCVCSYYNIFKEIRSHHTFVIEVHDFFSCGLYGFTDHSVYPQMLYKWFKNYIKTIK